MYDLKAAFRGASVFDCLKLKQMSKETAELLIDDLAKFEFLESTPELLAGLKEELPEVLRQARVPFDFSSVPGAAKYDAALARKLKRKADKAASTPSVAAAAAAVAAADVHLATIVFAEHSELHLLVVVVAALMTMTTNPNPIAVAVVLLLLLMLPLPARRLSAASGPPAREKKKKTC